MCLQTLIITDGKPGHLNQARALCSIMQWKTHETVVKYPNKPAKAATYILDWLNLCLPGIFKITPDILNISNQTKSFDVIVAAGSASYYPAKLCAKKLKIPVIALMYPRGFKNTFTHIICPSYDNPPKENNITSIAVTLSSRKPDFYENAVKDFAQKHKYQLPAASIIIGGDNKYGTIDPDIIKKNLEKVFQLTPDHKHWLTTSRRTSPEVEKILENFNFDYKLIYSKQQYNPIPAFIKLSDYLFVTSDSSSMISECVSAGSAKVEILKNSTKKKNKFDIFLKELVDSGCVHIFDGNLGTADKKLSLDKKIHSALSKIKKQTAPQEVNK